MSAYTAVNPGPRLGPSLILHHIFHINTRRILMTLRIVNRGRPEKMLQISSIPYVDYPRSQARSQPFGGSSELLSKGMEG
ncbi:MAG: hypothetical protein ABFD96_20430 [Armatimonadia bacterium]